MGFSTRGNRAFTNHQASYAPGMTNQDTRLTWTGSSVASADAASANDLVGDTSMPQSPADESLPAVRGPQVNQLAGSCAAGSGRNPFHDPFGDRQHRSQADEISADGSAARTSSSREPGFSKTSTKPAALKLSHQVVTQLKSDKAAPTCGDEAPASARDPKLFQISCRKTACAPELQGLSSELQFSRAFDRIELLPGLRNPDLGGVAPPRPFQAAVPKVDLAQELPSNSIVLQASYNAQEADPSSSPEAAAGDNDGPNASEEEAQLAPDILDDNLMSQDKSDPFGDDQGSMDDLPPSEEQAADNKTADKCDRIYNEENCCNSEAECRKMLTKLTSRSIRDISLDIAPPYDPLAEDLEESAELQEKKLAEIPSRVFLDRQGNTLAEGKLKDLKENNIIVQSSDGREVPVRIAELGPDDQCFVSAWWNLPVDCQSEIAKYELRDFTMLTFTWTASALCHKPLYFEDVQLERYGHSFNPWVQPFMSGAHFYASLALLPYNMGLARPNECQYDLGYYRPGNCAPWLMSAFPWHRRAVLSQVGAIAGLHGLLN